VQQAGNAQPISANENPREPLALRIASNREAMPVSGSAGIVEPVEMPISEPLLREDL
jgi:hypothetical protein